MCEASGRKLLVCRRVCEGDCERLGVEHSWHSVLEWMFKGEGKGECKIRCVKLGI